MKRNRDARLHARRPRSTTTRASAACACRAPGSWAPAPSCRGCCATCHVDEVIIAMPSAPGRVRQEIVAGLPPGRRPLHHAAGPPELITGEVTVSQLREVRVEDVLGRAPIEVDFARVARYLNGRAVLVTGAGGSIGRELCRQVAAIGARRLVMVDHSENNLFEIDLELRERGHAGLLVPVIADCKDAAAMERVFSRRAPRDRLPRGGLQARADDGAQPGAGDRQQRPRHRRARRPRRALRRRALLPDLHRQGRRAQDRHGRLEGPGRAGGRGPRRVLAHPLRGRALRQRARQLGARCSRSSGARSPRAARSR